MTAICEGLNVVEMGAGSIAGSLVGMVLADAGARVIKIEPPDGDRLRTAEPSGFLVWNRGKESLVADLRGSAGQQAARDLAERADVVVEGFSPGVTTSWGLGAETLRAANPSLVHCAITGFGPTGPYAHLKGYDSVVAAKLGLWARGAFSFRDGPLMFPVPWGSFGCAMQANLAAEVEDPSDLLEPRADAPRDSNRRGTVMQAYRAGQTTHAIRDADERSTVSNVASQ